MAVSFEYFEHAADVGVRGFGTTPEEAFAGAARALFSLVAEELEAMPGKIEHPVACEAANVEELLVGYLNELISAADARRLVFCRFEIRIDRARDLARLTGRAWGDPYDPSKHSSTVEPKGATFTELRVGEESGRWLAQCVIDV